MENIEKRNPLLEPENFFEPYQKNIDDLKNNPVIIEFDKLCFELFERNEAGRRFMELITERYLIPAIVPRSPTYQVDVLWAEGFKDFPRMIVRAVQSHQQRIQAGKSN